MRLRKAVALVSGVHSISQRKKSLLRRTALAYLNRLHERPKTYRFDIISIAHGPCKDYKIFALQECCFILIIPLNNFHIIHYGRIKTPIFRRFEQA